MADRKPDSGIESSRTFDVTTFTSQAGYEKRRLKSRRSKRNYDLNIQQLLVLKKQPLKRFITHEVEHLSLSLLTCHT